MESRFAHLRQRDTTVSMLRVKMSRRRSQSLKENRERAVNTRRQLDKLPELEISSLDASIAMLTCALSHTCLSTDVAGEERLKQLERWKERKALEKEKEKREKERKGIFKTGLYHPKDTVTFVSLPVVPAAPKRAKEVSKEPEEKLHPPSTTPCSEEEDMVVDQAPADSVPAVEPAEAPSSLNSFAPEGFVFQAPVGLLSFKFEPLTPRSVRCLPYTKVCFPAAFYRGHLLGKVVVELEFSSFSLPPAPMFSVEPQAERSEPSPPKSPRRSPPRTSPTVIPPASDSPLESKHDVPYFRWHIFHLSSHICSDAKCIQRRTTIQNIFCTFQVEDVNKKFDALKEAEGRGWVEEHKPPPRQRKVVKVDTLKIYLLLQAAKSRLAAVKAAMKARQQAAEAEKAAKDAGKSEDDPSLNSQEAPAQAHMPDTVVFDGGFFQVESPAKTSGSVRKSSRLSAAVLPQASPCSNYLTPRRVTRRSLALSQTPAQTVASPAQPALTPAHLRLTLNQTPKSQHGIPQPSQKREDTVNVSLCFSPVKEVLSDDAQPQGSPAQQTGTVSTQENPATVSELSTAPPVHSLPSISVIEEQDEPAEAVNIDLPVSPRLSLSPCKSPPAVSKAPEPSSALSFTLSPCTTPSQPLTSFSPAEIPGLDFERYLQPSQRCSLSPRETVAIDTLSPMAVDVEMESPRGQSEDLFLNLHTATLSVQTAESALLLFTPDLKDRIRQSVCPSDLMVFTPPH
uniref:Discs, large (Drosophila) homolog-associated protein 5 n=1 Tax=Lates calcarifer TaxID=8187 RepID=A0A4W6CEC0_LATCA